MESLESSPVGDAREVVAAMVLPVVHEGEIAVSGIQPEDEKGGDPGRKHEPEQPPNDKCPGHDDEERRADKRSGLGVMLRVTPRGDGGWAVQDPPMQDVLEQSPEHEPNDDHAAGHDAKAFLNAPGLTGRNVDYRLGDTIYSQGDPTDRVLHIQRGSVALSLTSQTGKEAIVGGLRDADFCGEGALADRCHRPYARAEPSPRRGPRRSATQRVAGPHAAPARGVRGGRMDRSPR